MLNREEMARLYTLLRQIKSDAKAVKITSIGIATRVDSDTNPLTVALVEEQAIKLREVQQALAHLELSMHGIV